MESKNENWILNFQKRSLILDFFLYLQEFQGKKKHDSEIDLQVETKVK